MKTLFRSFLPLVILVAATATTAVAFDYPGNPYCGQTAADVPLPPIAQCPDGYVADPECVTAAKKKWKRAVNRALGNACASWDRDVDAYYACTGDAQAAYDLCTQQHPNDVQGCLDQLDLNLQSCNDDLAADHQSTADAKNGAVAAAGSVLASEAADCCHAQ